MTIKFIISLIRKPKFDQLFDLSNSEINNKSELLDNNSENISTEVCNNFLKIQEILNCNLIEILYYLL